MFGDGRAICAYASALLNSPAGHRPPHCKHQGIPQTKFFTTSPSYRPFTLPPMLVPPATQGTDTRSISRVAGPQVPVPPAFAPVFLASSDSRDTDILSHAWSCPPASRQNQYTAVMGPLPDLPRSDLLSLHQGHDITIRLQCGFV